MLLRRVDSSWLELPQVAFDMYCEDNDGESSTVRPPTFADGLRYMFLRLLMFPRRRVTASFCRGANFTPDAGSPIRVMLMLSLGVRFVVMGRLATITFVFTAAVNAFSFGIWHINRQSAYCAEKHQGKEESFDFHG